MKNIKIQVLDDENLIIKESHQYFGSKEVINVVLNISDNYCSLIEENQLEVRSKLHKLLSNLGIPIHLNGFMYMFEAITLICKSDDENLTTKEIYKIISIQFDTTTAAVERAIRTAIENSWTKSNLNLVESLFGYTISIESGRPTNSHFLFTLAHSLK